LEISQMKFRESIAIAKKVANRYSKTDSLFIFSNTFVEIYPQITAQVIGTLHNFFKNKLHEPIDPLLRNESEVTVAHAREALGDMMYETAFTKGQNMSLGAALDLVLNVVEEI